MPRNERNILYIKDKLLQTDLSEEELLEFPLDDMTEIIGLYYAGYQQELHDTMESMKHALSGASQIERRAKNQSLGMEMSDEEKENWNEWDEKHEELYGKKKSMKSDEDIIDLINGDIDGIETIDRDLDTNFISVEDGEAINKVIDDLLMKEYSATRNTSFMVFVLGSHMYNAMVQDIELLGEAVSEVVYNVQFYYENALENYEDEKWEKGYRIAFEKGRNKGEGGKRLPLDNNGSPIYIDDDVLYLYDDGPYVYTVKGFKVMEYDSEEFELSTIDQHGHKYTLYASDCVPYNGKFPEYDGAEKGIRNKGEWKPGDPFIGADYYAAEERWNKLSRRKKEDILYNIGEDVSDWNKEFSSLSNGTRGNISDFFLNASAKELAWMKKKSVEKGSRNKSGRRVKDVMPGTTVDSNQMNASNPALIADTSISPTPAPVPTAPMAGTTTSSTGPSAMPTPGTTATATATATGSGATTTGAPDTGIAGQPDIFTGRESGRRKSRMGNVKKANDDIEAEKKEMNEMFGDDDIDLDSMIMGDENSGNNTDENNDSMLDVILMAFDEVMRKDYDMEMVDSFIDWMDGKNIKHTPSDKEMKALVIEWGNSV